MLGKKSSVKQILSELNQHKVERESPDPLPPPTKTWLYVGKRHGLLLSLVYSSFLQVPVTTITEFVQGKTWRWGVAWSFDETIKEKVNLVFYLSTCTIVSRANTHSRVGAQIPHFKGPL